MIDTKLLDENLENIEDDRVSLAAALRKMYPLVTNGDAAVDAPEFTSGQAEWSLIRSVGSDETQFEDCNLADLMKIVYKLKGYKSILMNEE